MTDTATSPDRTTPAPRTTRSTTAVAGHIPGLDGLRALAVLSVLAFHLWPETVPGGFVGVDVFFVISGFLITTLLVRENRQAGRIHLPSFWLRRARRLLPALLLVVATTIVAAQLIDRELLVGIGRQALGALTFSSNWLEIGAGADYFDHTTPVLFATFWSLAVEEQFYLLWPVLLLGVLRVVRPGRPRVRLLLGAALVSAVLMATRFESGANPTRGYYGTDTHVFGLMSGAALALAFADGVGIVDRPRWQRVRPWAALPCIVVLFVLIGTLRSDSAVTFRGGLVLASVMSAVVVACLPGPATAFTRVLELRPIAWIGERSYGIYLWHWPILLLVVASRPAVSPGAPPDSTTVALTLGLTLALATASYALLELPVRRHGLAGLQRLGRAGWVAAAALAAAAAVIVVTAPDKTAAQLAVEAGLEAIEEQSPQAGGAAAPTPPGEPAWPPQRRLPPGDRIVAFGDSVLSGAAPAIYERFPGILIDAEPIRQWRDAPAVIQAAGPVRPVVVLQFGTNAGLESDESQAALRQILDEFGPERRIVLVNTVGVSYWVESSNQRLAEIAADHPNVAVADWYAVVEQNPALLYDDRTHPTQEGTVAYSNLLAATIRRLGPGP